MTVTPRRQVTRILIAVVGLVALGETGHQLFELMGWEAGHHVFHLAYGAGAIVAFLAFAARDVRRHGLTRFTWSLRPQAAPSRDPHAL
jgi:hypothetical protein